MPGKYEQHSTHGKLQPAVSRRQLKEEPTPGSSRSRVMFLTLIILFCVVILRLFYWQVIHRGSLQAEAEDQYTRTVANPAHRGRIYTADGYPLVTNQQAYRIYAQPHLLQQPASQVAAVLAPLLFDPLDQASSSAELHQNLAETQASLLAKLSKSDSKWVSLKSRVGEATKQKIHDLKIKGIGEEAYEARAYPEASMAAHLVGFVGKDTTGHDQGYFGIEGALDRELRGVSESQTVMKDALGFHFNFDQLQIQPESDGRDVTLSIRRDVQYMIEEMLRQGMAKYGASAGEVIVMEPSTGKILGLAALPNYDPAKFFDFDTSLYKNPSLTETYEPGSTFKVLTMATGIESGAITPDTVCTNCDSARTIANYTIKTWNDQYHPNITMTDALAKSDNVAMIFASELIGEKRFVDSIKKFGIGEETHIELQEDVGTPFRKDWKPIDLATASFGQGIVTTGMQMVRAVGAIANGGVMMRPTIIDHIVDPVQGTTVTVQPVVERQVVSAQTAAAVTQMMVGAVDLGEAQWVSSKKYAVAGKTGTAQVPINGHYDEKKTIASFIGFAPAEKPRFVMLIKLHGPTSSIWAAETAAPLWQHIADKLFLLLNIPPDRNG